MVLDFGIVDGDDMLGQEISREKTPLDSLLGYLGGPRLEIA